MKFQKYLEAQRNSRMLRHLNYKALKTEVKRMAEAVKAGSMSDGSAAVSFGKMLEAEITEVGCSWEMCLWQLRDMVNELFSTQDMLLRGDAALGPLSEELRPLQLLEPLQAWLPVAALADALRRHRLLQMTAVVKIEKKFVKVVGVQLRPGFRAVELLRRSALSSSLIHALRSRLEKAGDALLRLGLGSPEGEEDACSVCLCNFVDPVRLPCSHRFCVDCVLPLFSCPPDDSLEAVLLRCPLCRAEGPDVPQALCLDGLLARLGRGMAWNLGIPGEDDGQLFTAVVVSSLQRLATRAAAGDGEVTPSGSSALPTKNITFRVREEPMLKQTQDGTESENYASHACPSAESLTTGEGV
eukprot:gb/GFBE01059942.1/.p1 GENE.gb/GFBE01059942.1/~~gb/GFBE01059942.1/.p1  ORF type:complete len:356 (+),score=68.11 gb/GFBE01059942.1/:1-1068(+)